MAMVLVTNIRRRRERGIGGICEWSDPSGRETLLTLTVPILLQLDTH